MAAERETMRWDDLGAGARELARMIAADGYEPEMILSIARGGLLVGAALGYALDVKNVSAKPASVVRCDYVWRRTDRWIDFPWSAQPPVAAREHAVPSSTRLDSASRAR